MTDTAALPPDSVRGLGPTLVVAPHPDDEVLGCGGTIALLRRAGLPVRVLIVSDGGASHPGSTRYPPAALAALRHAESLAGLAILGVDGDQVTFLNLADGAVPGVASPAGDQAVNAVQHAMQRWPDTRAVFLPWRRDPHDDHRATWTLASAALDLAALDVRRIEYPIWTLVHPGTGDAPRPGEARCRRLDISPVLSLKRTAILSHRSQTTDLIDDAEIGFCLTPTVLERFDEPWEVQISSCEEAS